MTASESSTATTPKHELPNLFRGLGGRLAVLIAATAVFGSTAWLIAWVRLRSYFSQFGHAWIADFVSPIDSVKTAGIVLIAFAVSVLLLLPRLIKQGARTFVTTPWIDRTVFSVTIAFIVASRIGSSLDYVGLARWSAFGACVSAVVSAALATVDLIALRMLKGTDTSRFLVATLSGAAYTLFWFAPSTLGTLDGVVDTKDPRALPLVTVVDEPTAKWRLLLATADRAFIGRRNDHADWEVTARPWEHLTLTSTH